MHFGYTLGSIDLYFSGDGQFKTLAMSIASYCFSWIVIKAYEIYYIRSYCLYLPSIQVWLKHDAPGSPFAQVIKLLAGRSSRGFHFRICFVSVHPYSCLQLEIWSPSLYLPVPRQVVYTGKYTVTCSSYLTTLLRLGIYLPSVLGRLSTSASTLDMSYVRYLNLISLLFMYTLCLCTTVNCA